jgi:hypothetical protein
LARLEGEHWQPNLSRLEQFPPTYNMTQDDYAESWAWAHFLLESRPEHLEILRAYLADLRRDGTAQPPSMRLAARIERPDLAMLDHVRSLASGHPQSP